MSYDHAMEEAQDAGRDITRNNSLAVEAAAVSDGGLQQHIGRFEISVDNAQTVTSSQS